MPGDNIAADHKIVMVGDFNFLMLTGNNVKGLDGVKLVKNVRTSFFVNYCLQV